MRFALTLLLLLCISGCDSPVPPSFSPPSSVDEAICKASQDFLPVPHRLFGCSLYRAQLYQESLLDPAAVSPAGAVGIAQFMAGTWEEVLRQMDEPYVPRTVASVSIRAGAFYMAQLRAKWTAERPEAERMKLAQGSYNAGFGRVLAGQRQCGGVLWEEISPCVPRETQTYVERIWRYWKQWALS